NNGLSRTAGNDWSCITFDNGVGDGAPQTHQERVRSGICGNQQFVRFPFRLQPTLGQICSAPVRKRPHETFLSGPILGYNDFEYPPSSSRVEVRRLSLIACPKVEVVLGTERHIDLFLGITVEVPKPQRESPIRVPLPSIKSGTHILSARICDSRKRRLLSMEGQEGPAQKKSRTQTTYSPPRRGGVARQLNRSWRAGVARSASPIGRSLNRSSAKRCAGLTTPSAPLRSLRDILLMAQPPLLCEEGNASWINADSSLRRPCMV